jgi:hypothetical protein
MIFHADLGALDSIILIMEETQLMRLGRHLQVFAVSAMAVVPIVSRPLVVAAQPGDPIVRKALERSNWRNLQPEQLKALVITSSLTYGLEPSPEQLQSRAELHQHFVKEIPLNERLETLELVTHKVEKGVSAARSLEPFIYHDPAYSVVASAALKIAVLMPLRHSDEMTGPKYVCQLIGSVKADQVRGQMLSGLLLIGDQRVMPTVRECFRLLGPAGRRELARSWSGFAHKAVVDFLVDWLDDTVERGAEFGSVAGTLGRLAIQAQPRSVLDVRRRFPANEGPDQEAIEVVRAWSIREYGQIIAPRLRALAQRERAPKVIPVVMDAWGIE